MKTTVTIKDLYNTRVTFAKEETRIKFPSGTNQEMVDRIVGFVENARESIKELCTQTLRGTIVQKPNGFYSLTMYKDNNDIVAFLEED